MLSRAAVKLGAMDSQKSVFWQADRQRKSVHDQFMAGTVLFEFTCSYRFATLDSENVWAKAMHRVVNDKVPVDKAVDELVARIKEVAADYCGSRSGLKPTVPKITLRSAVDAIPMGTVGRPAATKSRPSSAWSGLLASLSSTHRKQCRLAGSTNRPRRAANGRCWLRLSILN